MGCYIHKPSGILSEFVKCIWILDTPEGSKESCDFKLIPSGCIELMFHFSTRASYEVEGTGNKIKTDSCIAGQRTRHTNYNSNSNSGLLSVMLQPSGANILLGLPANKLFNSVMDSRDIWGREAEFVADRIACAKGQINKFQVTEEFLINKLNKSKFNTDNRMTEFVRVVSGRGGNVNIDRLSQHLNISRRQLERKSLEVIGYTPKEFCRIIRFQKLLFTKQNNPSIGLTELSYSCGYTDQSHMVKEFKSVTGEIPTEYFRTSPSYSDYYSL